jgi:RNA polymerase sigma factor for flagellar operon FliA
MIASPNRQVSAARRLGTARPGRITVRAGADANRRTRSDRAALLTRHVGLVHHVARQLARRLSTAADLDEMVSAGMVGLIQAADTFDAARGLSFSTYAVPRIRGAILDELRRQDALPRNVRRRTRDLGRARAVVAAALRRAPTHEELGHVMGVPAETIRKWELDAEGASVCSLDQPLRGEHPATTLADTIAEDDARGVEELLTHEAEVERLKRAILDLKEQERTVLALNFFEELKLHEIAEVLQLSVCRISQIRTAAIAKLRVSLSDLRVA